MKCPDTQNCPDTQTLERLLDGTLSPTEYQAVEVHVETCDFSQETLRILTDARNRGLALVPGPYTRTLPPGTLVGGKHVLRRHIARGGQGDVYEAWQQDLNRPVAVKMLLSRSGSRVAARLDAFREEAAALAKLTWPHIVPIFDYGEHDGRPYFVMEFMPGGSLAGKGGHITKTAPSPPPLTVTANGATTTRAPCAHAVPPQAVAPLPPEPAARLVETLARAVHYAHGRKILHRDLKPHNVLLAEDGTPKIGDFGLAWQIDAPPGAPSWTPTEAGSLPYMAPEAAGGLRDRIGPRTDVYGLGAILYEVLTGRPPFRGETDDEVRKQVQTRKPVPPSPLGNARDLNLICLKCLEKDPEQRYASAEILADELGRFRRGELPEHTRPVGRLERLGHWGRRNPALATAASLAAAAAAAVVLVSLSLLVVQGQALRASKQFQATLARDQGLRLGEQDQVGLGALWLTRALETAPGDADEFRRTVLMNLDGWGRKLGRLRAPSLPHPGAVHALAFSPDGRRLATGGADGTARIWDVGTGKELLSLPGHRGDVLAVTFSPDGGRLVTGGADGTARIWDAGTGKELLPLPGHRGNVQAVAFSPDGQTVATGSADGTARLWDWAAGEVLCSWDVACGPGPSDSGVHTVAFSPDGAAFLAGGA
jgi:hypothetical protein